MVKKQYKADYVDADIDVDDETHIVTLSTCSYNRAVSNLVIDKNDISIGII